MISFIRNFFSKDECDPTTFEQYDSVLTLEEINRHFKSVNNGILTENEKIVKKIKHIDPNKKNIFLLDKICVITDILEAELNNYLCINGNDDKVNVISLCGKNVGFDMLGILSNHPEISIDYLVTDINFGGCKRINNRKIIIDGIDILVLTKILNPNNKFVIFTGNHLSTQNVYNYSFSTKFLKYVGDCILDHIVFKDSNINFECDLYNEILGDLK